MLASFIFSPCHTSQIQDIVPDFSMRILEHGGCKFDCCKKEERSYTVAAIFTGKISLSCKQHNRKISLGETSSMRSNSSL